MWIFVRPENIWGISLHSFCFLLLFQLYFSPSFPIISLSLTMEVGDDGKREKDYYVHIGFSSEHASLCTLSSSYIGHFAILKPAKSRKHEGHALTNFFFQIVCFIHASVQISLLYRACFHLSSYCFIFIEICIIKNYD